MTRRMHEAQLTVGSALARDLVEAGFPEFAGLPVRQVLGAGTVNAIFRIGHEAAARFPLEMTEPEVLVQEAAALTEFADASPFAAPRPLVVQSGSDRYPSAWSVQSWVPGSVADPFSCAASDVLADDLVDLILALRAVPTAGRVFDGRGRGGALADHDEWMAHCLAQSAGIVDVERVGRIWTRLSAAPALDAAVMSHRDLTPPNLLVSHGRLVGVLDGGAFGPTDPALDLVAAWHLLDEPRRARLRAGVEADDAQWRRGAAWALVQAMGLVWYYETSNPTMAELGRSTVVRVLSDQQIAG